MKRLDNPCVRPRIYYGQGSLYLRSFTHRREPRTLRSWLREQGKVRPYDLEQPERP